MIRRGGRKPASPLAIPPLLTLSYYLPVTKDDSSDNYLARRAADGCEDAAKEIVDRFGGRILGFLNKRNSQYSGNEDILQETLITAFARLHTFDFSRSFSAWMFGIARNKSSEHLRKIDRIEKLHAQAEDDRNTPSTPFQHLDQRERSTLFWERAKNLLSVDSFECLWLKYQEDLSIVEIADALGKKASAIKVNLFRARKTLSDQLEEFQPPNQQPQTL